MNHLRVGVLFKGNDPNPYIGVAFPTPVAAMTLYRNATFDDYEGDITQVEFSVTDEEIGEMLCSQFLENEATLAVGKNCVCAECETNNIPLTMVSRSGATYIREALQRLGLL
jgi:hypothetical protein